MLIETLFRQVFAFHLLQTIFLEINNIPVYLFDYLMEIILNIYYIMTKISYT